MPTRDIYRWPLAAVLALGLLSGTPGAAHAFDPHKTFKADEEPRTVLRFGFNALKKGKMDDAIGAFKFGAERNDLASQWKLARMLQTGSGVKQDHVAAFNLYTTIADRFAETIPTASERGFVSSAIVALGGYYLTGIPDTSVKPNPRRAEDHFYRASALYHDPNAQYELGKLYRSEALGVAQPRTAARWLGLSAKKGHHGAQAELGQMLFYGEGIARRPVRGLVYLSRASSGAARSNAKAIRKARKEAFARATKAQRQAAKKVIEAIGSQPKAKSKSFGLVLE